MTTNVFLINNKHKINKMIKRRLSKTSFKKYLDELYYLNDEISELNEIKSIILKNEIYSYKNDLSAYKADKTNKFIFQKAVNELKEKSNSLKMEVIKLLDKENIIEDIMKEFELQWDKSFIENEEYLLGIYNTICPIGIAEYIENLKSKDIFYK